MQRLRHGSLVVALALLAGCAHTNPLAARRLPAGFDRAFDAASSVAASLGPIEVADRSRGRIETGYSERLAERTQGYVLGGHLVERRRFALALEALGATATAIAVEGWAETRAPGGTRAISWERAEAPTAAARAILDEIEARLEGARR